MAYTFMIRCRASDDLSLAIVDGEPVLTKADAGDQRQVQGVLSSVIFRGFDFQLARSRIFA
jgi:hypothetical protein